jgi:hypothetical protein
VTFDDCTATRLARLEQQQSWQELCRILDAEDAMELPVEYLLMRVRSRWNCGRHDASVSDFRSALEIADQPQCQIALAKALIALGRHSEAGEYLSVARSLAPDDPEAVFLQALNLYRCDQLDAAVRDLIRLVRRHPDWQQGRVALWQIGRLSGNMDRVAGRLQDFPATPFEQAQKDSFEWFGNGRWTAFSSEVLCAGVDAMNGGDVMIECGVYHGRSLRVMKDRSELHIHGFDSFEGLPEAWGHLPSGSYSTEGAMPELGPGITLHKGWFEQTLPTFVADRSRDHAALVHIDCDLYSSTVTVLETLKPMFRSGTILVFDDLLGFPDYRQHELRALEEFIASSHWQVSPLAAALVGREAAFVLST